ncbi:MAG: hypothetical protein GX630_08540, partial [Actinobacteria bacterium]|nr:hypothetical protein [Actinomycetota bacterium]
MRVPAGLSKTVRVRGAGHVLVAAAAIIAMAALSLLLAGCAVEVGLTTTVEKDGSGTTGVRFAADKALQDALSQAASGLGGLGDLGSLFGDIDSDLPLSIDTIFALIFGTIPTDWSMDQGVDDNGATWISLSHRFDDLQQLEELSTGRVMSLFMDPERFSLTQDRGFFRTTTAFTAKTDISGALRAAGDASGLPLDMLGDLLTLENRVTLPGSVGDNNADHVVGDTLVWDMSASGDREMRGESVMYDWVHIGLVAFAALIGFLILLFLLLWLIRRSRRRRRAEKAQIPPPPPPPDGGQVPPPPPAPPV